MSPDKDAELRRRHPLVFQRALINDYPIQCGDGWFALLDDLCGKLNKLIAKQEKEERHKYAAVQVKEKFGLLRFYIAFAGTRQMQDAIRYAENESEHTCDVCGAPGDLVSDKGEYTYWLRTRCKQHENEREKA